ncbi:hypothetical protein ANANG_G00250310 [Anguilla anguilla]|uniref:SH3 domain-containing protein n=1 Tax=Anguilla anguilla TaxID=7936 RepID=A0A9D3LTL7_ANGAN|nr:hypothetical protein ANANG_G00250310 [Anguilla anguilla]
MILQHEVIFPGPLELQGPVYEKCMTLEQEYCEPITEEGEGESEHPHSEDIDCDAVAMFDYVARSTAELSFKQGDHLLLHCKASPDWWKGEVGGVKGLIPHKYISVSDGGGHQPERGRREDSRGGSTGNLSEEKQLAEQGTRLRVNSDSASLPSRQKGGGSCSPVRKLPQHLPEGRLILPHSPGLGRQHAGLQERRNTLESEVSRQMNSVFKELLARQPPDTATPAPAVASSPPPSAPLLPEKGRVWPQGRDLFKPAKPQD